MELIITDTQIIIKQSFMTEYIFRPNITDIQVYGADVVIHYSGRHDEYRIDYSKITLINGAAPTTLANYLALITAASFGNSRMPVNSGDSVPNLPIGVSGSGSVYAFNAGVLEAWGIFAFNADGTVTLIRNSVNTDTTNTPGFLCIMQNSTLDGIEILNNLAGTRDLVISLNY